MQCSHCGYDLRGTDADSTCPECGPSIAENETGDQPVTMWYRVLRTMFLAAGLCTGSLQICFESTYGRGSPSRQREWIGWYYWFQPTIIQMAMTMLVFGIAFLAVSNRARHSLAIWGCVVLLLSAGLVDWIHRDSWLRSLWQSFVQVVS